MYFESVRARVLHNYNIKRIKCYKTQKTPRARERENIKNDNRLCFDRHNISVA